MATTTMPVARCAGRPKPASAARASATAAASSQAGRIPQRDLDQTVVQLREQRRVLAAAIQVQHQDALDPRNRQVAQLEDLAGLA